MISRTLAAGATIVALALSLAATGPALAFKPVVIAKSLALGPDPAPAAQPPGALVRALEPRTEVDFASAKNFSVPEPVLAVDTGNPLRRGALSAGGAGPITIGTSS